MGMVTDDEVLFLQTIKHYLLGHSVKAIAAEGVMEQAITTAIRRGLENMKKYLKNVL